MTTNAGHGRGLAILFLALTIFMVFISASGFTFFLVIAIATFVGGHVMVVQVFHRTRIST